MPRVKVLVCALSLCACVSAQDYRAKVLGVVSDPGQAAVAGAKVTLLNVNTGVSAERTTSERGAYLFDFIEPGTYRVTVDHPGFNRFVQDNILVQVGGDITADAALTVGSVSETITISDSPPAVQFTTSSMAMVVDQKMLTELPTLGRNPFNLVSLNPGVVPSMRVMTPFQLRHAADIETGGGTFRQNDIQLDGAPLQVADKASYTPPMDSVQEFAVQQNSVDAEFGHSAGGIVNVSMKSGTNQYRGVLSYFGRNPALNAVSNVVTRSPNIVNNHSWGGSGGGPIRKNRIFTFFGWEQWRYSTPRDISMTLPTGLERGGDFSKSLNRNGGLRTIYDPWSTTLNPQTGAVARAPFAGNVIPAQRLDPTAVRMMKDIWLPNAAPIDLAGSQNFRTGIARRSDYFNLSNRTDWVVNDRLRIFGRFSTFRNTGWETDFTNRLKTSASTFETVKNAQQVSADAVYVATPSTIVNVRWSWSTVDDTYTGDYPGGTYKMSNEDLAGLWPGNAWYKPYTEPTPYVFYPYLQFPGAAFGKSSHWIGQPGNYISHARVSRQQGPLYVKAGFEWRHLVANATRPMPYQFRFSPQLTADTFLNPNTALRGDPYAAFLLGAMDDSSFANFSPFQNHLVNFYAGYVQNDWKVNRMVTLNLGLRYEYGTPPLDPENRLSRYLDLSSPIPEVQARPPLMPPQAQPFNPQPKYNGAWIFTDADNRGMFRSSRRTLLPRIGAAVRLDDRTALRVGYARYVSPPTNYFDNYGGLPMPGFDAQTTVAPMLAGVPGARLSNPFPAGSNPLIVPLGKSLGRYQNLGGAAVFDQQDLKTLANDRLNVSFQRQWFWRIVTEVTYFGNFGRNAPYTLDLNLLNPALSYQHKTVLTQSVPNPFYNYLTPDKLPGQLRNLRNVSLGSLLVPYPHYQAVQQRNTSGARTRYHAVQARVQRQFSNGLSFFGAYNYQNERAEDFFNADDQYAGRLTYQPDPDPRHRITGAGTYEVPVGRGRRFLAGLNPVLDAALGGWSTSSIFSYNSGSFLTFGQLRVSGNPVLENPTRDMWFDTSVFQLALPFTPRENPRLYPGLTGPCYWNLNTTLAKFFSVTERIRIEFRIEAYNTTNSVTWANPNTARNNALFGRVTGQSNTGREMQYALRIHF